MYQTVGHTAISLYAEAMGLPLFRGKVVILFSLVHDDALAMSLISIA